jgi:glycosyltransferase involved in cell wall biosynthesis
LKVLKLCYEYPPLGGGGGHVVAGLAAKLTEMGCSVDLLTMKYKKNPSCSRTGNFSVKRVPCIRRNSTICHPHEMLSYLCMALPMALKMVNKNTYDIIHAHFIFPDGVLAHLLSQYSNIPYVITTHGSDVPGYNPDRFIVMHKILQPIWKSAVRSCSQVICSSRFLEYLLKNVMPDIDTVIIPNGFQPGRFRLQALKSDKILVVTRMFKRKGVQHFLRAVDGLPIDYEIHIVGDGPYLKDLKQLARKISARIQFHGFVDNRSEQFRDLIATSKIFVFPSGSENFPVVLLEAMDAGLAIITTRDTGCEEVVGNTGILITPGDVVGLRNALLTFINNPALIEQSGQSARKRLDENFSWDAVAKRYVCVYESVMNNKKANQWGDSR